jgi:hypothetical protein
MTEAKIYVPTTDARTPARTYNQNPFTAQNSRQDDGA